MNTESRSAHLIARSSLAALAVAITFTGISMVPVLARANNASDGPPQQTVHFSDLDLSSKKDIDVLYRRIERAADAVCGSVSAQPAIERARITRACRDHAISQAVVKIHNPLLNGVYVARTGHEPAMQNLSASR